MANKNEKLWLKLLPIMLAFFVMGFVDLVGIATNYVKTDFNLSDTLSNLLPSMVFVWFLVFSVPTGLLMNRIGRKNTVLISVVITFLALLLPSLQYSFLMMMVSFALIGIGNTLMQVSLNPLLSNIISGEKLASNLTLGQFVKAIASFIAPIIAGWAAVKFGNWKLLFPIFMVVSILSAIVLWWTKIDEEKTDIKGSSYIGCLSLLKNKVILVLFLGIMCHVGIDVGINVTAPKIIIERLGLPLAEAGLATSVYFLFRTIGCFSGTFILSYFSPRKFFFISTLLILIGIVGLFFVGVKPAIYACVALIGFGNSNIFPMIFSKALKLGNEKKNEVSGLMIMGLFGGTIFPLLMGVASDLVMSQIGAICVICAGVLYLLLFRKTLSEDKQGIS